jgi:putative transposase
VYSYEDGMRAVELYIKLGERVGATIRQLGYPTKNALKAWYQTYQVQRALPRGYVRLKPTIHAQCIPDVLPRTIHKCGQTTVSWVRT